jgi:hypothetical protein
MADDDESGDETAIQVESLEERGKGPLDRGPSAVGAARKAVDIPVGVARRTLRRYRRLDKRDKFVVLVGALIVVMVIVVIAIAYGGGGRFGGDGDGVEMVPVSKWRFGADMNMSGQEENTNLEGQETIYPATLDPAVKEVFLVTALHGHVTWTDEPTPPAQVPAFGYDTNEPDAFQLEIRLYDEVGLWAQWESELVYNPEGGQGAIDFSVDLQAELDEPVVVANPFGAKQLPEGYQSLVRVDFIVMTEDCGDWPAPDPIRPTIGDGGNHFLFEWDVLYRYDDDGKP